MLVFVTSTALSQVTRCGDKVCVDVPTMDSLVYFKLNYKTLTNDAVEYKFQISSKNERIASLKATEYDLKESVRVQKMLADNYKSSAIAFQDKYTKTQDKAKFRGKVLIGSLSLNLVLVITAFLVIKL